MKNLIEFNESTKFFEIKSLVDNLKDMLVELDDEAIDYSIEPKNEIRMKFIALGKDGYFFIELKKLESKKDSYNILIENIKTIVDYMDGNGFDTKLNAKYSIDKKDTYSGEVKLDRLISELNSGTLYWIQIDFIMREKPVYECLPNDKSIKQLEMVAKLSKKTDIGNRISDMNKEGANLHYIQNPIETGIESREEYEEEGRKQMKHLKKYNKYESAFVPVMGLLEFSQEHLISLIDRDFIVTSYTYNGISIQKEDKQNFTWLDVKDEIIPFVEALNNSYDIISVNRGGDDTIATFLDINGSDHFSYSDIIDDNIHDDLIMYGISLRVYKKR